MAAGKPIKNIFNKETHPNCYVGHQYALDVAGGKIIASIYTKGACERYLREVDSDSPIYYFDEDKAERYLRLVQKFKHVIGHWASDTIKYEPWQCFIWMNIMGFVSKLTGFRRFRIAHIEIPRGNAKSTMASQAALYFLALEESKGNYVATTATKKEQARIVLDAARAMAKENDSFLKNRGVKVLAHTITQARTNSVMRALSSEASSLDGLNDVLAVCDELHAMKRETFDVIYSGMSKRKDSLTLCITTAGMDIESVGYTQSVYAKKICEGLLEDDQFFAIVYTIDEGDDIYAESTWRKANPNWDVSVDPITFKAKADKTKETPSDLPNFKIKHLNTWLSEARAFFDKGKWNQCAGIIKLEDFKGKPARMGIDLASHIDLTSIALTFFEGGKYYIFDKTFIPEKTVSEVRSTLYDECIAKGYLIATPGEAINYDFIRKEAEDLASSFRVQECMYDTWNATEMAQKLSNKIEMVKFSMNVANFSEPMKKLDSLIRQGKVVHNGSPLLSWCIGNVVAKEDHNGNVFPRKSHVRLKIDPVVAILMSLAGWLQKGDETSVYETRGILTF